MAHKVNYNRYYCFYVNQLCNNFPLLAQINFYFDYYKTKYHYFNIKLKGTHSKSTQ